MRVYTYSEARQNLSELLSLAEREEIVFSVVMVKRLL